MKLFASVCVALVLMLMGGAVRAGEVSLTGAGATFPQPLYEKWISEYTKSHPDVKISYAGIGSGGGIKQITVKEVDFGASDAPLSAKEIAAAKNNGQDLLQLPMTLGGVVPIYNIQGLNQPLKFSGPVLADLFSGKITKWSDAKIKALNADVADKLPDAAVKIVHRDDPSGTTYVFTEFLSKVSSEWKATKASDTWATGSQAAKGNNGVATAVKGGNNTLGYVESNYALDNKLAFGDVLNKAGKSVHASIETVSTAANVKEYPEDLSKLSLTYNDAADGYPISSTTFLLVPKQFADQTKAEALVQFINWCVTDGQKLSGALYYSPLPEPVARSVQEKLKMVMSGGKPVMK